MKECRGCRFWKPFRGSQGSCMLHRKRAKSTDTCDDFDAIKKFESVEEYLARGGSVKKCPRVRQEDYEMSKPPDKRTSGFEGRLKWGSK